MKFELQTCQIHNTCVPCDVFYPPHEVERKRKERNCTPYGEYTLQFTHCYMTVFIRVRESLLIDSDATI